VITHTGLVPLVEVLEAGTLPRTSSGKLRRREAQEQLLAGTLRPPTPVTPVSLARAMLLSSWKLFRAGRAG
jgi:hypothetical protein